MNAGTQDDDLIHELDHINEIDYKRRNGKSNKKYLKK
jgi:hypothetical protein